MLTLKKRHRAFTLIEILTVVAILAILSGLLLMASGYTQRRAGTQATRALLCSLESSLEAYKLEYGRYPTTLLQHFSDDLSAEKSNSFLLYQALFAGARKFGQLPANSLATEQYLGITYIRDAFQRPVNYYCTTSPTMPIIYTNVLAVTATSSYSNFFALGGQVSLSAFDLFSYGPDQRTYLNSTTNGTSMGGSGDNFKDRLGGQDDIWCSSR